MDTRERFRELLNELFRIESSDLDFGIYRIMNQKREEINNFIEKDIDKYLDSQLTNIEDKNKRLLEEKLEKTKKGLRDFGITDYSTSPEYNKIKKELEEYSSVNSTDEIDIYEHIYNFFKRYYDNGDFISQMRYSKENKYVVPYNGEEVHFHWTNRDQYYVKTSENFVRYIFDNNNIKVEFIVDNAELDKNNIKDSESRYFILHKEFFRYDNENNILDIYFEYRSLMEDEKEKYKTQNIQNKINKDIFESIKDKSLEKHMEDLGWLFDKLKGSNKTILERHIYKYTKKNKSDYFIHKDLKGFLNRELDFYIKNEILDLETIAGKNIEVIKENLIKIEVFKNICEKIIEFLNSIEDFQKKLFTKKKFVLQSDYCLTLDKISDKIRDEIFKEILSNKRQLKEWKELYGEDIGTIEDLYHGEENLIDKKQLKQLMIDTQFFNEKFKYKLLSSFEDLDGATDGLLINSENYQGLNLLKSKYNKGIKCIYIDPPYNTDNKEFLFKDGYKSSTWLSFMYDRVNKGIEYLEKEGVFISHIDENELDNLLYLYIEIFGKENVDVVIWRKTGRQSNTKVINRMKTTHEYLIFGYIDKSKTKFGKIKEIPQWANEGTNLDDDPRGNYESGIISKPEEKSNKDSDNYYSIELPSGRIVTREWYISKDEYEELIDDNRIYIPRAGDGIPRIKIFENEENDYYFDSIMDRFGTFTEAKSDLEKYFGYFPEGLTPKTEKMAREIIRLATSTDSIIMDFFAGSGTSAIGNIILAKEERKNLEHKIKVSSSDKRTEKYKRKLTNINRKYILMEMGNHFNTVLKPRIQKKIFSDTWQDGESKDYNGHSHMFKYISLEQYEDSLRNVKFQENSQVKMEDIFDDYLIKYMLDYETQKSILDIEMFKTPFEYKIELENENKDIRKVDLVETFNYLIGLQIKKIKVFNHQDREYRVIIGKSYEEEIIVIWRNIIHLNMEKDKEFIEEKIIRDNKFDKIYINCDNFVKEALLIEEQFSNFMFEK